MADALSPRPGIALSDDQRLAWLRLIRSENVGPNTFKELINYYGTAQNALDALPEISARTRSGKQIKICSQQDAERELEQASKIGAQLICMGEANYPQSLLASDGAPPLITVRGDPAALTSKFVAIVGSRNASLSGLKFTRQLAAELGQSGFSVVSGLARGIDSAAHEASVLFQTAAVFAGGIDHIYPRENGQLVDDIVQNGGALVSEMPIGAAPRAQDFPKRNRIVAGMALGLVVVEAARRSGSLISARLANEMGRLVFAVPGSPLDPRSEGTNHLIREGATLITSSADVIDALNPISQEIEQASYSLFESGDYVEDEPPSDDERMRLINALDRTPTHVDELVRHLNLSPGSLQLLLLELDLAGKLERHAGNRVSLL